MAGSGASGGGGGTRGRRRRPGDDPDLRHSFLWWGRLAFGAVAAYFLFQLLLIARGVVEALLQVVLYVIFGAVLALVCRPLAELLIRRARLPRTLAVLISLAAVVAVIAGLLYAIAEPLLTQTRSLTEALPRLSQPFSGAQTWLNEHGIQSGGLNLAPLLGRGSSGGIFAGILMQVATGAFAVAVAIVVVLVTAFWLLRDHRLLRQGLLQSLPVTWRPHVEFVLAAAGIVVGGYVRAQLSLALLVGTLATAGCWFLGVPFPLVVGVATSLFELIPLVGPFVGAAVGGLLALTVSPSLMFETLGLFLAIHVIEGYLVAPRLQGRFVQLHPLLTFLSLLAGIEVGGLLGGLFAVPATSLAAVLIRGSIGDWRANRPELFAPPDEVEREVRRELMGRRRALLRSYRIVSVTPRPTQRLRRLRRVVNRRWLRRHAVLLAAVLALIALVVSADPVRVGSAVRSFRVALAPAVIAVSLGFYVLQGVRWWTLLRPAGIRARLRDTVLATLAGQMTALLPLGELTRSVLLARITDSGLGAVVATETVQEILFVGLLFAAAIPGSLHYPAAAAAIIAATCLITVIIVLLCVAPVYHWMREHVVRRLPLLRRITAGVDELQRYAVRLFTARSTYLWLWLSALQALLAITLLWLVVDAIAPGIVAWDRIALVYAVTQGAGWVSMSPGGLGAFELSTAGFLYALGVPYSDAAASALIFRIADKGLATLVGFVCFARLRARFDLGGSSILSLRQSGGRKRTVDVAS